MVTKNAREIVGLGEKAGLSNKKMAEICNVSPVTISRWKFTNRARTKDISALERHLNHSNEKGGTRMYLDEANLEDLAQRARQLGFRITFTDINIGRDSGDLSIEQPTQSPTQPPKERMSEDFDRGFKTDYDRSRVEKLCNALKSGPRGVTLGREILRQLNQGYLDQSTYERLSRWVNPYRDEDFAQPIAAEISALLFGEEIERNS
jgi:hypothetical protein